MHARFASLACACAVGTLSDDTSLGEPVIDAFWPHCLPDDWSVMMTVMTMMVMMTMLTKMMTMMTKMMTMVMTKMTRSESW